MKKDRCRKLRKLSAHFNRKSKVRRYGIECFYSGGKLELLPDSTFVLTDSNYILFGKWHLEADLVDLHFLSNKYANDILLNKSGRPEVPLKHFALKRNSPDLYGYLSNSNGKYAELLKLKF